MCGLVGIASEKLTQNHVKMFKQGLYVDMLRGKDSTGIAVVPDDLSTPIILKKALIPTELFELKECKELLINAVGDKALIGHNRAATKGHVTNNTAHPFQIDHITLVHNGTLWQHRNLPDGHKFIVDSEAITHSIANIGIEETIKRLDGAFALVLYDQKEKKLHIVRNNKRELWMGFPKGENTVMWASEKPMLELISSRNNVYIDRYLEVEDHVLYTFDLDDVTNFKEAKVEGKKQWGGYWDDYDDCGYYGHNNVSNLPVKYKSKSTKVFNSKTPEELGYAGDSTPFFLEKIIPYNYTPGNRGMLKGFTCDAACYPITVYGINILHFTEEAQYTGRVCNVIEKRNCNIVDYELTIHPHNIKLAKTKEEYLNWIAMGCPQESKGNIVDIHGVPYVELDGCTMTEDEAVKALKNGCCQCGDPIPLDDAEDIVEFTPGNYLCTECTDMYLCDSSAFDHKETVVDTTPKHNTQGRLH